MAWPAGRKKKMPMMSNCGAINTQGSHAERKSTRFSMTFTNEKTAGARLHQREKEKRPPGRGR